MAKTTEIMVNGQLTVVTEFDHSAQEIDDAVAKVEGGPAALGAAPAGFGGFGETLPALGSATTESDQNVLLSTMYGTLSNYMAIQFRLQPVVGSTTLDHAIARMYRRSTNYGGVDVSINGTTLLHKSWFNGAWGAWEWVNPPMQLGVEYRTTERYLGKPVYAKAIDFGALPNNTEKQVNLNITNIQHIVNCFAAHASGDMLVSHNIQTSPNRNVKLNILSVYNGGLIRIQTDYDASGGNAYINLKYTKSTD